MIKVVFLIIIALIAPIKPILVVFVMSATTPVKPVMELIPRIAQAVIQLSLDIWVHHNAYAKVATLISKYNYAILVNTTYQGVIHVWVRQSVPLVSLVLFSYLMEYVDAHLVIWLLVSAPTSQDVLLQWNMVEMLVVWLVTQP